MYTTTPPSLRWHTHQVHRGLLRKPEAADAGAAGVKATGGAGDCQVRVKVRCQVTEKGGFRWWLWKTCASGVCFRSMRELVTAAVSPEKQARELERAVAAALRNRDGNRSG